MTYHDAWLEAPYQAQMRADDRFEAWLQANADWLEEHYLRSNGLEKVEDEKGFKQWCALQWEDNE